MIFGIFLILMIITMGISIGFAHRPMDIPVLRFFYHVVLGTYKIPSEKMIDRPPNN